MVAQKNIIQKVQIAVNTASVSNGMKLKDGLAAYFYEEIFPEIDLYFNSLLNNEGKIFRIDTISLEININDKDSLSILKELIIKELKSKIDFSLNSRIPLENSIIKTAAQSDTEALLYFLETGNLPWWSSSETIDWTVFFENFDPEVETKNSLKKLFAKAEVRKRLVYQFDDSLLFKMVLSLLNFSKPFIKKELKIIEGFRMQFWEASLNYSIHKNPDALFPLFKNMAPKQRTELFQLLNKTYGIDLSKAEKGIDKVNREPEIVVKNNSLKEETINSKLDFDTKKDEEGILIQNAGLILLHPFLKMFFEKMEFLSEKTIKPEKIDEAINALHYLATGKEQPYEYELVFEKFLCNLPLHFPVNRHIQLTKAQKMACEILLVAVLGHWTALKSKSTEILQNEFLQREGKLIISSDKQQLFIQRKTQDILLNKLPWNLHLIKIPWHKKVLYVEW